MTTTATRALFASTLVSALAAGAPLRADPNRATPGSPTVATPTQNNPTQPGAFQAPPPVTQTQPQPLAPPPVTQPMPVMQPVQPMVQPPPAEPARRPRAGAFGSVFAGAGVPTGDLGTVYGAGFHGLFTVGWRLESGLAFRAELGYRTHSSADFGTWSTVSYGGWIRYEIQLQGALHPYVEAGVDAGSVLGTTVSSGTDTTISSTSTTLIFAGGAVGLSFDLSDHFALEAAARYEQVLSAQGGDGYSGGMVSVFGGATLGF